MYERFACDRTRCGGLVYIQIRAAKSLGDALCEVTSCASGGSVVVKDPDILEDRRRIAEQEGKFISPEGASMLTELRRLVVGGLIKPDDRVILLSIGTGSKYMNFVNGNGPQGKSHPWRSGLWAPWDLNKWR